MAWLLTFEFKKVIQNENTRLVTLVSGVFLMTRVNMKTLFSAYFIFRFLF